MLGVRRLGHATLATPDIARQVDYWTDVMGLQVVSRGKDNLVLATKLGQEAIVLEQGAESQLKGLSFQVDPGSDLQAVALSLRKAGIESERRSDISPAVADAIVFRDPKGTLIEIFSDTRFHAQDKSDTGIGVLKFGHI